MSKAITATFTNSVGKQVPIAIIEHTQQDDDHEVFSTVYSVPGGYVVKTGRRYPDEVCVDDVETVVTDQGYSADDIWHDVDDYLELQA